MTFLFMLPLIGQTCFPIVFGAIVFAFFYLLFHQNSSHGKGNSKIKSINLDKSSKVHGKKGYKPLLEERENESSSSDSDETPKEHDPTKPHICSRENVQKISSVRIWCFKDEFKQDFLNQLLEVVTSANIEAGFFEMRNPFKPSNDSSQLNIFLVKENSLDFLKHLEEIKSLEVGEAFLYHICSLLLDSDSEYMFDEGLGTALQMAGGIPLKAFEKFRLYEDSEDYGRYKKKLSRILKNSSKKCCGSCIKGNNSTDIEDIAGSIITERIKHSSM